MICLCNPYAEPSAERAPNCPVHSRTAPSAPATPAAASLPTFEERYGPWICMGCGLPHKLGTDCPPSKQSPAPLRAHDHQRVTSFPESLERVDWASVIRLADRAK
jgi:hypothetical protein